MADPNPSRAKGRVGRDHTTVRLQRALGQAYPLFMTSRTRIGVLQTQRLQLTMSLHASIRILRDDAQGLTRFLEEQAAETPALALEASLPAPGEWLPRWTGVLPHGDSDPLAHLQSQDPSLMSHVAQYIVARVPSGGPQRIAFALAEALEPTGWLGRPLTAIAAEQGVGVAEVEAVLAILQQMEPTGLFARDLAECLRLQAVELGLLDAVMEVLLSHLDVLASGDWATLARMAGVDQGIVAARFRTIRSFNPKPGASFSSVSSPLREPDLIARHGADGWEVAFNKTSLPGLRIVDGAKGLGHARETMRLIENRNQTLIAVARAILSYQRAALEAGPGALRPLKMQAVADQLSLHKSTVSRVVSGTAVDTPHGTWWLRALFSPDMGDDLGAAALRARLSRLIAAEDPKAPLSDQALAEALSEGDVMIARRTVAKYRSALRIAPAHRRRQRKKG
jgi:RNA polymerase sigma-54 factor